MKLERNGTRRIEATKSGARTNMKAFLGIAALTLAIVTATAPADAKGCIKGAVVGGIAGHAAHHGLLGAAAGCLVGRHMAKKHERENQENAAPANGQQK
jgi:hypothetical protein